MSVVLPPVRWISGLPWPGSSRHSTLIACCDALTCFRSQDSPLMLMRRGWMVSCRSIVFCLSYTVCTRGHFPYALVCVIAVISASSPAAAMAWACVPSRAWVSELISSVY
eukprot:3938332-Rhodomonas_salina.4